MPVLGILASGNGGGVNWISFNSGSGTSDRIRNLATDSSENIYSVGVQSHYFSALSAFVDSAILVKQSSSGAILWQKVIYSTASVYDSEIDYGVAVDSSNNVYICGQAYNNSAYTTDGFVMKYNSSGTLQWHRKLVPNSSGPTGARLRSISVDSSGNVFVSCFFSTAATQTDGLVFKYNTSGTLQWRQGIAAPASALPQAIFFGSCVDTGGNSYHAGIVSPASGNFEGRLIKYSNSGSIQWNRSIKFGANDIRVLSITSDASSNIYSVGHYNNGSGGYEGFVTKHDPGGNLVWQRTLNDNATVASRYTQAVDIAVDSSANVYATFNFKNSSGAINTAVVKYNTSGSLQWQRSFKTNNPTTSVNTAKDANVTVNSSDILLVSVDYDYTGYGYDNKTIIASLPNDGSKTGTVIPTSGYGIIYGTASLTDAAGSLTNTTVTDTASTMTYTEAAGTLTIGAGDITTQVKTI